MRAEVPPLFPVAERGAISTHALGRATVGLIVSGVGPRRARAAAERLCREFQPDYLVSLGVCGGVADGLAVGDLVVADEVARGRERIDLAGSRLDEAIAVARRVGGPVHVGAVRTYERPLLSRRGLSGLVLGADMEAYAVAQVARERGLPVVVVKAISDIVPDRATPRSVAAWLWRFRAGFLVARETLASFAARYLRAPSP